MSYLIDQSKRNENMSILTQLTLGGKETAVEAAKCHPVDYREKKMSIEDEVKLIIIHKFVSYVYSPN